MEKASLERLLKLSKFPVYLVILIVALSTFFGSAHLVMLFVEQLLNEQPARFVLNIDEMFTLFNSGLTIVVGYELIKALVTIIKSHDIPATAIIKIALIALLNKVITTDYAHVDIVKILAMSALMLALGVSYFLFRKGGGDSEGGDDKADPSATHGP